MSESFVTVFAGGLAILICFTGWGWAMAKLLRLDDSSPRPPLAEPRPLGSVKTSAASTVGRNAALGLAWTAIAGGFVNFFHSVNAATAVAYLALGVCLALFAVVRCAPSLPAKAQAAAEYMRGHKGIALATVCLAIFALLKFAAAVSPGLFNPDDDYSAYFAFPVRMIQDGFLGNDPFSYRRLTSALGGQTYLDTFSLMLGGVKNLHLMDMGVAFLIVLMQVAELAAVKRVRAAAILVLVFAVALFPPPIVNISAVYTSVSLLILMFEFVEDSANSSRIRLASAIAFSIVLAGGISLKYSVTPVAGLLWLGYFGLQLARKESVKQTLVCAAISLCLMATLLAPWMGATYQSSGTFFFGVLGHGFHSSRYGIAVLPTQVLRFQNLLAFLRSTQSVPLAVILLEAIVLVCQRRYASPQWRVNFMVVASSLLCTAAIAYEMGGYQVSRLIFPIIFPAIIYVLANELSGLDFAELSLPGMDAAAILLLGLLTGAAFNGFFIRDSGFGGSEQNLASALEFAVSGRDIISPREQAEYEAVQSVVPAGQRLLVRYAKNFMPDFKRNPVYIMDNPGLVSLPPGMPAYRGPEPLADYFVAHGIRYLAYSYGDQAGLTREEIRARLDPKNGTNEWIRSNTALTADFQDNLDVLAKSRKKLFDDGKIFVLDLATRAESEGGAE